MFRWLTSCGLREVSSAGVGHTDIQLPRRRHLLKPETFVLFVDMLGFATLTLSNDDAVDALTATYRSTKPVEAFADMIWRSEQPLLAKRFYNFHHCIDAAIGNVQRTGGAAIAFSDSAFLAVGDFERALSMAIGLMRDCIQARVPVRMGLARGSFRILRFLSDSSPGAIVHTSQFLGSAVVGAYQAESCGAKGLRILVHPDLDDALHGYGDGTYGSPLTDVPKRLPVRLEVNYLHRSTDYTDFLGAIGITGPAEMDDHYFPTAIKDMVSSALPDHRDHYDMTRTALDAMRRQLERPALKSKVRYKSGACVSNNVAL